MRYAIIGSNSFTGSWMIDELLADRSNIVLGISRSPEKKALYLPYSHRRSELAFSRFHFYRYDIVHDFDHLKIVLDQFQPECVINYAAQTEVYQSNLTPAGYFETNTLAVVKLCKLLSDRDYLKRFVQISSAELYGTCNFPARETTPPLPTTPYAVSKLATDLYLMTLHKYCGFPVIIIRTTNVYGSHQQLYKIIPRSIIRLKQGEKIELHDGGRFIRPFIHVKDACRGVMAAIEKGTDGNIYNFTADCNLSIDEVVRLICQKMGQDFEGCTVSVDERTGHDFRYCLDDSKARAQLEWLPEIPFEKGLDEVIAWVEENWKKIQKEPHTYQHKE